MELPGYISAQIPQSIGATRRGGPIPIRRFTIWTHNVIVNSLYQGPKHKLLCHCKSLLARAFSPLPELCIMSPLPSVPFHPRPSSTRVTQPVMSDLGVLCHSNWICTTFTLAACPWKEGGDLKM